MTGRSSRWQVEVVDGESSSALAAQAGVELGSRGRWRRVGVAVRVEVIS